MILYSFVELLGFVIEVFILNGLVFEKKSSEMFLFIFYFYYQYIKINKWLNNQNFIVQVFLIYLFIILGGGQLWC